MPGKSAFLNDFLRVGAEFARERIMLDDEEDEDE